MIHAMFPTRSWTHVYTDGSAEEAARNGGRGAHIKCPDGTTKSIIIKTGGKALFKLQSR